VLLNSDEIEVACDALWFMKCRSSADDTQQQVWERLQAVRSGDFGGSARAELLADTSQPAKWPDVLSADCMLRARRSPNVDQIAGRTRSSNPNRCAQWRSAKRHESRLIKHGCADFAITRTLDNTSDWISRSTLAETEP